MRRFYQILLIATFVPLCWLGMMAVHEAGHILAAFATGGAVTKVVLHPLAISRTDVQPNPQPLVVVWAGPVFGVVGPLVVWAITRALRTPGSYLLRFFAGFCCICNGAYIGIGSIEGVGDCGGMLQHGSPMWSLWLFGLVTLPAGLALWNGQGRRFGLGEAEGRVSRTAAMVCAVSLAVAVVATCIFSPLS